MKQLLAMLTETFPDVSIELSEAAAYEVARCREPAATATLADNEKASGAAAEIRSILMEVIPELRSETMESDALSDADFFELLEGWVDPPVGYETITPPEGSEESNGDP